MRLGKGVPRSEAHQHGNLFLWCHMHVSQYYILHIIYLPKTILKNTYLSERCGVKKKDEKAAESVCQPLVLCQLPEVLIVGVAG